jgi:hypothetical protein
MMSVMTLFMMIITILIFLTVPLTLITSGIVLKKPIRFAAVWGDGAGTGVLCGAQTPLDGSLAPWIN